MNKSDTQHTFLRGMRNGIPIGTGYFAVSFAFGIMAADGGLSIFHATLISLTNLTSAGQLAGLNVILENGSYLEIALTQLVINLRYSLMSFSLTQKIVSDAPVWQRLILSFGITDENFAVTGTQPGRVPPSFMYGVMAVAIPGWVSGTLLGALLGNVLPGSIMNALSVAIYGMFIAIIIPPAKKERPVAGLVICAMLLSALFAYIPPLNRISGGFVIIIVTVITAGACALLCPVKEGKEDGA